MKEKFKYLILLFVLFFLEGCVYSKENKSQEKIIYQQKDKQILEEALASLSNEKDIAVSFLMIKAGMFFLDAPYVDHTLEFEPEELVINLREFDCTTFAETCLALSKTLKSDHPGFEQYSEKLREMRYRDGKIENYLSRIHYFSDWIYTNAQKGIVQDISKKIGVEYELTVNFMSSHPDSYRQLKSNPELVAEIAELEKEISSRAMYYVPKENIADIEEKLQDGDIAGITTSIRGLDISHVAVLVKKEGRVHILHASSDAKKVVVSKNTLEDYLSNNKTATGIMVARPL